MDLSSPSTTATMDDEALIIGTFDNDLPPELRNNVYDVLVAADNMYVASKPLADKSLFCSRFLPSFSSALTQAEYRPVVAHRMLNHDADVQAIVRDFNFVHLGKFLRKRERAGTLNLLQENGGTRTLDVSLVFSKDFDGSFDRALRWVRVTNKLAAKYGTQLRTKYTTRKIADTQEGWAFRDSLEFSEEEFEWESEWARIMQALQEYVAPAFDTPSESSDGWSIGDGSESFDENGDWIPEDERPEKEDSPPGGPPIVHPLEDEGNWGEEHFAQELLGRDYYRTPEFESSESESESESDED